MKQAIKIAIVAGLLAFVTSCEKENGPAPGRCHVQEDQAANERMRNPETKPENTSVENEDTNMDPKETDAVIGGGDEDRDGGGKKVKKRSGT